MKIQNTRKSSCGKPQEAHRPRYNVCPGGGGCYPSPGQRGYPIHGWGKCPPVLVKGVPQSCLGGIVVVTLSWGIPMATVYPPPAARICDRTGVTPQQDLTGLGYLPPPRKGLGSEVGKGPGTRGCVPPPRKDLGPDVGNGHWTKGWGTPPPVLTDRHL